MSKNKAFNIIAGLCFFIALGIVGEMDYQDKLQESHHGKSK